jgi:hypothetical protein
LRGGCNKKTIQQHIADGTYRADRHGLISSDNEQIKEIKKSVYSDFVTCRNEIRKMGKIDFSNKDEFKKYIKLLDEQLKQIKLFLSLCKIG